MPHYPVKNYKFLIYTNQKSIKYLTFDNKNNNMRKILAVLFTLITLYVLKQTFDIFVSNEVTIVKQRPILIVISVSISLPLVLLSLWLWRPKNDKKEIQ